MAFSLNNSRNAFSAINGDQSRTQAQGAQSSGGAPFASQAPLLRTNEETVSASIIGHDLELRGTDIQIIVRGKLRVDGKIAGEVYGQEITIGRDGQVSGRIVAEKVAIHGTVSSGEIYSHHVSLMSGSNVEADIHHRQLAIEEGARFDGRSRRTADDAVLPSPEPVAER